MSQMSISPLPFSENISRDSSVVNLKTSAPCIQSWTSSGLFRSFCYSRRRCFRPRRSHLEGPSRKKEREYIIIQYRAPPWLLNRAWSMQLVRAISSWTFSPRSYNVIPSSSILFEYIKTENIGRLRDLFDRREASPFDCNEKGATLLHVCATIPFILNYRKKLTTQRAVRYLSFSICKLLVEQGAEVDYRGVYR